jgi:methylenetetrahydrofolate dehydrogenase (NADP+)/methenyltetrahydrofolate cyclohydrolase/formyltetrahydrofolate synthetase
MADPTQYLKLDLKTPVPSDIEIAMGQHPKYISQVAGITLLLVNCLGELGLFNSEIEEYGHFKAKVSLSVEKRLEVRPNGKYIVVTGYHLISLKRQHNANTAR